MDFVTQRFISIGNRVVAALRGLRGLRIDVQQLERTIRESSREQQRASSEQINPPPEVRVLLDAPQGIETRKNRSDAQEDRHYERAHLVVEWGLWFVTLGAFVSAAIYAYIAHTTLKEIRKQTAAVECAARAAASSANTAGQALKSSQDSFGMEQRPYLWGSPQGGVTGPNKELLVFYPTPDGLSYTIAISILVTNSGRSPAVDLHLAKTVNFIGPKDQVREQVKHFVPAYNLQSHGDILSSGSSLIPVHDVHTITNEEFSHLQNGTWQLFAVGGVQYGDIFQPKLTSPYETTYCSVYRPQGMQFGNCSFGRKDFGDSIK